MSAGILGDFKVDKLYVCDNRRFLVTQHGDPFFDLNPAKPNEDYFLHVDAVVNLAEELGLYVGSCFGP